MSQQLTIPLCVEAPTAPTPSVVLGMPSGTHYRCPCCGSQVNDEYIEGDALCCLCRDIDDPRYVEREPDMVILSEDGGEIARVDEWRGVAR